MMQLVSWRFALAAILLTACQKDSDLLQVGAKPAEQHTLATFVAVHGAPTQLFTLTTTADSSQFKTVQGNRLVLPANAFLLPNGLQPSPTPISVEFREVSSKVDMVLSAVPTTVGEQLLESSGAFYLKAKQGTTVLRLNPAARVKLQFQNPRFVGASNLALFFGTTTKTGFTWLPKSSADLVSAVTQDSLPGQPRFYRLRLNNDSLGWITSARPITRTPQTTVRVAVNGEDVQATNTMVFLVFKSLNTVVRAYAQDGSNTFTIPNVPQGLQATAVVLRNVNGRYFFGQQPAQITANHTFIPNLATVNENDVVDAVKTL